MPQEFKAIVSHTRDASVYQEVQAHDGIEQAPVRTRKGAEFTILTDGPFPWPPSELLGEKVVVFGYLGLLAFLARITETLSDHADEHIFCESKEKALAECRELLARLTK